MLVKILKRFVDDRGHMQAPGVIREVTEETGRRLVTARRAVEVKAVPAEEAEEEGLETEETEAEEVDSDAIPARFPERDRLLSAGITTLTELRNADLSDIEGVGPSRQKKIQEALDALEA